MLDQLRAATALLKQVADDRSLLAGLTSPEHQLLLQAAGEIFCPDVQERRRLVKARTRQRKAAKLQRDQKVLTKTGIRKLRQQKVFTTPNVFVPENFEQHEVTGDSDFREVV